MMNGAPEDSMSTAVGIALAVDYLAADKPPVRHFQT
jgi:hypothetical protein